MTEESTATTDTGTTAPEAENTPDISDSALEAALTAAVQEESGKQPVTEPEKIDEPSADTPADTTEEESSENSNGEQKDGEQPPVTRQEFDKQTRQLQGLELLVQRRTSELGQLKSQLKTLIESKEQGLQERFLEDPAGATRDVVELTNAKNDLENIEKEEQGLIANVEARKAVHQFVPEGEFNTDEMAASLARDGMDAGVIEGFKKDPFAAAGHNPFSIVQLARRARAESLLAQVVEVAKALKAENEKLKKTNGKDVLRKIDKVARHAPTMTAGSGGSTDIPEIDVRDVANLSTEQIDAMLQRSR